MEIIKITAEKAIYAFCASTCGWEKAIDCVYGNRPTCCEARYFLWELYENREKEENKNEN